MQIISIFFLVFLKEMLFSPRNLKNFYLFSYCLKCVQQLRQVSLGQLRSINLFIHLLQGQPKLFVPGGSIWIVLLLLVTIIWHFVKATIWFLIHLLGTIHLHSVQRPLQKTFPTRPNWKVFSCCSLLSKPNCWVITPLSFDWFSK